MREKNNDEKIEEKGISGKSVLSFIITLLLCSFIISITVINRVHVEQLKMEQLIFEKSAKATEVISQLLHKTQALASFVLQSRGKLEDFEWVAATIHDNPVILNLLLAPDGKVSHVYPLEGNEKVIGHDFYAEVQGNKEALLAIEREQLVFGGPFDVIQGGQALAGRLPVYITDSNGVKTFWGLVSVTLKYPDVLDSAGFQEMQAQGFAYEIWRINPDTDEKQIISHSGYEYSYNANYVEKHVSILGADWYFRILPVRMWYQYPETWILVFLSLCVSLLVAVVIQNNFKLEQLKLKFETMSQLDSLTGIYNRRYFMELTIKQSEKLTRFDTDSFIVFLDIDHFKNVNDTYGHKVGDGVLQALTARVKRNIRASDIFARFGGEEFILLIIDVSKDEVLKMVERIRLSLCDSPFSVEDVCLPVTASFGIASVSSSENLDKAISTADEALYHAKADGRNRIIFYDSKEW